MKLNLPVLVFILLLSAPMLSFAFSSEAVTGQRTGGDTLPVEEVKALIREAKSQVDTLPRKALANAQKAIGLLQKTGNNKQLLSEAYFEAGYAYNILGKTDSSVIWFNKVLSVPDLDADIKARTFDLLGINYRKLGDYQRAHQYADKALKIYRSINDSAGIIKTLINDARVYNSNGNHKKAMHLYFKALDYTEKVKDTLKTGQLYGWIANVYMDIDNDSIGKIYYRKAIRKLKFYKSSCSYADNLNNYGIVFYDEEAYDSALFYFLKALDVYQKVGQTDGIAAGYQNIGISYVFLNRADEGLKYLFRAAKMFKDLNLPRDQASALVDVGRAYIEMNRFDSAGYYLHKALDISTSVRHAFSTKEALRLLYKMNEKAGNYKQALSDYKNYMAFKDSIDSREMKENLQELEVKYQTARREQEILKLKERELLDKAQKKLLIVGIVGLVFAFGLTVWLILLRRKKDLVIQRQKILVYRNEQALAKAELEKKQTHEKQMQNELEYKTKQLATHALNMMQKNKLLQDIKNDIEERLNSSDCKSPATMKQVKQRIQQGLNVDKDWDVFKLYFEQVNQDFFKKLKEVNPHLTANDFRLAALIKLNMSIKEMASVLNISPDSLKNARYRLKKKLNLKEEENMNAFIRDL